MAPSYVKIFETVVHFFERSERDDLLEYLIVGGALTSIYAQARQTQDIDFVIRTHLQDHPAVLARHLTDGGFQPFSTWRDTLVGLHENHFINFLDPSGILKIDVSLVVESPRSVYERLGPLELKHRQRGTLFGVQCWIQSKEDFILSKLVFGGIQDYKDALTCWLRHQQDLDLAYLDETTTQFQVTAAWAAIQRESPASEVFPAD